MTLEILGPLSAVCAVEKRETLQKWSSVVTEVKYVTINSGTVRLTKVMVHMSKRTFYGVCINILGQFISLIYGPGWNKLEAWPVHK